MNLSSNYGGSLQMTNTEHAGYLTSYLQSGRNSR